MREKFEWIRTSTNYGSVIPEMAFWWRGHEISRGKGCVGEWPTYISGRKSYRKDACKNMALELLFLKWSFFIRFVSVSLNFLRAKWSWGKKEDNSIQRNVKWPEGYKSPCRPPFPVVKFDLPLGDDGDLTFMDPYHLLRKDYVWLSNYRFQARPRWADGK